MLGSCFQTRKWYEVKYFYYKNKSQVSVIDKFETDRPSISGTENFPYCTHFNIGSSVSVFIIVGRLKHWEK